MGTAVPSWDSPQGMADTLSSRLRLASHQMISFISNHYTNRLGFALINRFLTMHIIIIIDRGNNFS